MKRLRITRTTLEKHEVTIVKAPRQAATAPSCPLCPERIVLVTVDQAVTIAGVTSRVIHRWIESGDVHFVENPDGVVFLCPASLVEASRSASWLS